MEAIIDDIRPPLSLKNPNQNNRRLNLSICSIFKNEAQNLPELITCLPLTRIEWNVLDTGSTDVTVELLRKAGIEPHTFTWVNDFSVARNASLKLATRDWILWLDGDDRIDENFWDSLEPLLTGPKIAYRFIIRSPRENSYGERFRQIRLFPNHHYIQFEGRIHEQLGTSIQKMGLSIANAELEIVHIGYNSADKRKEKLLRNRILLEQEKKAHPLDLVVNLEYANCLNQCGQSLAAQKLFLSLMPSPLPKECKVIPDDEVLKHYPALLGETCVLLATEVDLKEVELKAAEEWFQLATKWNPSDIQPFYWLGKNALSNGNIHGALEQFYFTMDKPAHVGRVASDSYTIRRNALALIILCEMQLFGVKNSPRSLLCLKELIHGGLKPFPLDYHLPWEFYLKWEWVEEAEKYARIYLGQFSNDIPMWENFIEFLNLQNRFSDSLEIFSAKPELSLSTGILAAFKAKALEANSASVEKIYSTYCQAIIKFPQDPTLLVYFSEFVNHNKLYSQCYADLKALPESSNTVNEFLRQLELQGLVSRGVPE